MLNFEMLKQRVMKALEGRLKPVNYKLTSNWFAGFVEAGSILLLKVNLFSLLLSICQIGLLWRLYVYF
mgnify:CR=1 FL=1